MRIDVGARIGAGGPSPFLEGRSADASRRAAWLAHVTLVASVCLQLRDSAGI
jgi:hypothetical protein